jgi:hypothetical protein
MPSFEEFLMWLKTNKQPPSYKTVYDYFAQHEVSWPTVIEYTPQGKPHEIAQGVLDWLKERMR